MLFTTPKLTSREMEVIHRIGELRKSLSYAVRDPVRWQVLLSRAEFARAVKASNSIEGYNVTVDDAIAAYEGEEPLDAETETWMATVCNSRAMTYVLQLSNDPHFQYSTDLIRSLHFMMLEYDLAKNPGRWRPGPISIRDSETTQLAYEAPDAEYVPGLMDELIDSLNRQDDDEVDLVRAAMTHLNLVMIHPFSDGNGRMARCIQTLTLARTGVLAPQFSSIELYLMRHKRHYYDVLAEVGAGAWNPGRDTLPWVRFCLKAHFYQATRLLRHLREMKRLWDELETEIKHRRLPERMLLAVTDAAVGFRVRNGTYRRAAELGRQLASRDLAALVKADLLIAHGDRKGRYYLAADSVKDIRIRTREPKVIEDPFAEKPVQAPVFPAMKEYMRSESEAR